jgi:hypothetical protein
MITLAGAWSVACGGGSDYLFEENAAAGIAAGSGGHAGGGKAQGGTLSTGATESAGGSAPNGGTTTSGGTEPEAGSNLGGNAGQDSGGGSGGTAETGGTAGSGGATSGASGMGNAGTAGSGGGGGKGGSGGTGSVGPCPNLFGAYSIMSALGNCDGLNENATQSITGNVPQCLAQFVSPPQEGGRGINGAGALDSSGDFKGAVLSFNGVQRTNCSGTWDAVEERMTVQCGGGFGEPCVVVLDRN